MNCPNCKSILKDEEKICRVCGWAADEPGSIMNWFYIQKRRSSKLIATTEILATIIFIPLLILIACLIFKSKLGGWQGFIEEWIGPFIFTIMGIIIVTALVTQSERFKEHNYVYRIFKNGLKIIEFGKEIFYKWSEIQYFNLYSDYLPEVKKGDIVNRQNKIYIFFKEDNKIKKATVFFPTSAILIAKIIDIFQQNVKHSAPYSGKLSSDPHFFKSLLVVLIIIAMAIIGTLIIYFTIGPI